MDKIPYGRQNITDEDIDAVIQVLKSDEITQGPKVKEFEAKFAKYVGSKYAVAVSNGTAALHIAAKALNVTTASRVIVSPLTFVATANAIRYCGGEVHFADIDPDTYLLDLDKVRSLIQSHPEGYFEGIIPVDFAGQAVNMEDFRKLASEHNLWIIEDAAHAPGGFFIDAKHTMQKCGSCVFAELAIFSFHPVKHIACGEGGMVTTNDEVLHKRLQKYRSHGITSDSALFYNAIEMAQGSQKGGSRIEGYPTWYMEMQTLGFNYRLTDIQSALGIGQLSRANWGIEKRREIAKNYYLSFKDKPYIISQAGIVEGHAYHLYVIEVKNRLGLYNYLKSRNINSQVHYIPVHLMPYYQSSVKNKNDLTNVETYYSRCLSIPMFPTLTEEEQAYVIKEIDVFFEL